MQCTDIGIDLGTASILVYIRGKGVVLKEPSVVAFDRDTNKIKAIGEDARLMLGRTPGNIVAVRPLRQGVISDYTVTEKMMKYFIQKALGKRTFRKPRIAVCVPSGVTEVEKKAVEDATYQAGAREVSIIEEPIAAAIGAGIDISKPCGNMIVDIGGGTSDIAVISLGGTVVSASIKIAGDDFDEAIVRYMRKKHNLLIGERTAEDLKGQKKWTTVSNRMLMHIIRTKLGWDSGKTPRRFYGVPWPEQYAILFDLTRAAPPRTRTPNLSVEDMLRTYELAASGSLMPVGDNTWAKTNKFASVPPSRVIEAQFVNVT